MNELVSPRIRWRLRRLRPVVRRPLVFVRHLGLRGSDWILAEYPKSGGTWLAFMLGEALFDHEMDFTNQGLFLPAVGRRRGAPAIPQIGGRILRTHEPRRPVYDRAIYLVRHVADVAVSYHRWLSWLGIRGVDFDEFLPEFLAGRVDGWGPWQRHVGSWLDSGRPPHLVRYEDLRSDTERVLSDTLRWMGAAVDPDLVKRAVANNTFERMREKEAMGRAGPFRRRSEDSHFVREGGVGESRRVLGPGQIEMIDRYAGSALHRLGYELLPATPTDR